MANLKKINRREFLGSATAASLAFTVVPRQVLGGPGYVAPSDKITLGIYRLRYPGFKGDGLINLKSCTTNSSCLRSKQIQY